MAENLIETCNLMRRDGADFPTIWREVIKPHRLVGDLPVSDLENGRPIVRVSLRTGQCLVFGDGGFSLR